MPKTPATFVRLPDDDRKWLEEYAWQNRQSMSSVIAEAVAKYRKTKERKR